MKRSTVLITVGLVAIAALSLGAWRRDGAAPAPGPAAPETMAALIAGPGLVEAQNEAIKVAAQVGGRLERVLVEEGDRVEASQMLAVIENADFRARVASAEAELAAREADERRVINGARAQERQEAAAGLAEAQAVLSNAKTEHERRRYLLEAGFVAAEQVDQAERAEKVARARVDAARQRLDLVEAAAREEDVAAAGSAVRLARARLDEARAVYEKTFIRAPIAGVVLRRHRQAGESVSTQFDSPVVTIADDRARRVRVDVDEADVAGLSVGQAAYVTADGFPGRRFEGRVVRVGQILGRKNVRTDEPNERVDMKILETLVELDGARELPIGLRVQAFITRR